VMEAAVNPTRAKILALLAKEELSFAQIMKSLEISNSGLLFFHLRALQKAFLIKKETKSEGPYRCAFSLTDLGKTIVSQLEQIRSAIVAAFPEKEQ